MEDARNLLVTERPYLVSSVPTSRLNDVEMAHWRAARPPDRHLKEARWLLIALTLALSVSTAALVGIYSVPEQLGFLLPNSI